jgi:flagellar protein FliL
MAKPSTAPAEGDASAKAKKSPLLLIVGVGVLALALGGGAAWFFLVHKSQPQTAAAEAKPKHDSAPVFVTLEPFVVNLSGDVQHYLQVGIDLRVVDTHVIDQIKVHLPEIRNGVLLLLSSKSVEDLSSVEQKNRLRAEIREAVNKPLGIDTPAPKPEAPKDEAIGEAHAAEQPAAKPAEHKADAADAGVVDVLLTSFVIQ